MAGYIEQAAGWQSGAANRKLSGPFVHGKSDMRRNSPPQKKKIKKGSVKSVVLGGLLFYHVLPIVEPNFCPLSRGSTDLHLGQTSCLSGVELSGSEDAFPPRTKQTLLLRGKETLHLKNNT